MYYDYLYYSVGGENERNGLSLFLFPASRRALFSAKVRGDGQCANRSFWIKMEDTQRHYIYMVTSSSVAINPILHYLPPYLSLLLRASNNWTIHASSRMKFLKPSTHCATKTTTTLSRDKGWIDGCNELLFRSFANKTLLKNLSDWRVTLRHDMRSCLHSSCMAHLLEF